MNYLITYAILGTVVLVLCRAERRRFERAAARDAGRQSRRDYDKLDVLIEATREWPHESYAWGPDAGQPVGYLAAEADDFERWTAELEDQR